MSEQRITLSDAVDYLVANGRSVGEAETELLSRLRSGDLQAIAQETTIEYQGGDGPIASAGVLLEPKHWTDAVLVRSRPSSFQRYDDFDVYENQCFYTAFFEAEGVLLFRAQLERSITKREPSTRSKGGRPPIHDWARAAATLAAHVVENDYPTTERELTIVLLAWFKKDAGKVPDQRDAERFVAEMYRARSKSV